MICDESTRRWLYVRTRATTPTIIFDRIYIDVGGYLVDIYKIVIPYK